jgi:hypothetical protein
MVEMNALLQRIADQTGAGIQSAAVTDDETPPDLIVDFPIKGSERILIQRSATGGAVGLVVASYANVLPSNNRRIGGTIVNRGEADARLLLTTAQLAGAPGTQGAFGSITLKAGGGSWDMRLGPLLWAGNICAAAIKTGAIEVTTLDVVEV